MKNLKEYIFEEKNSLTKNEMIVKSDIDEYFKDVLKDTHLKIDWDLENIPDNMKDIEEFRILLYWLFDIIPDDIHEFIAKYFFRKLFIKSRIKLPKRNEVFDNLYEKYKEEIEKAFADDKKSKEKLRKNLPDYYKNIKSKYE